MFSTFQAVMSPGHNGGFQQGLYKRTYTGYFGGTPAWFATATLTATSKVLGSVNIGSQPTTTSCEFTGWFKAPFTETVTFTLSSDDKSQMWVGDTAKAGTFSVGNKLVSADTGGDGSGAAALTKGVLYPIRIQFGNNGGPGFFTLTVSGSAMGSTSDLSGLSFFNPNTRNI